MRRVDSESRKGIRKRAWMRFDGVMRPLALLLGSLRRCLDVFPDKRRGLNTTYRMGDIGMAAFSVFFMQSPSFLAHQRHLAQRHGHSNCQTLIGMTEIPSDNHIRDLLDPVPPEHFYPVFTPALEALEQGGGLAEFRRLDGHVPIAFDGTEYTARDHRFSGLPFLATSPPNPRLRISTACSPLSQWHIENCWG